jgi:hypothetical protein
MKNEIIIISELETPGHITGISFFFSAGQLDSIAGLPSCWLIRP